MSEKPRGFKTRTHDFVLRLIRLCTSLPKATEAQLVPTAAKEWGEGGCGVHQQNRGWTTWDPASSVQKSNSRRCECLGVEHRVQYQNHDRFPSRCIILTTEMTRRRFAAISAAMLGRLKQLSTALVPSHGPFDADALARLAEEFGEGCLDSMVSNR